jgi:alkylated DNA nucleotide flippase Atl1
MIESWVVRNHPVGSVFTAKDVGSGIGMPPRSCGKLLQFQEYVEKEDGLCWRRVK